MEFRNINFQKGRYNSPPFSFIQFSCRNNQATSFAFSFRIHHFHIDHNAPCLPPSPLPATPDKKKCITNVFSFYRYNSRPTINQRQSYAKFGGLNKVYYGLCENGEHNQSKPP